MKKRIKKTRKVKPISRPAQDRKISAEEYVDSVTDIEDNTKPGYPFNEGKPMSRKEDDKNS